MAVRGNSTPIGAKSVMENKTVRIGDRLVGDGQPAFLIAEIGINHNGDLDLAKRLIDASVKAGADAVKFQKRTVDVVYGVDELARERERARSVRPTAT